MRTHGANDVARSLAVLVIVLCAGLAACQIGVAGPAPIVGRNCGAVHKGAQVIGDPRGPENCLWQAWTRCQTATLVYTEFGVDTGETHTVTVQPGQTSCVVRDAAQGYSANGGGSRSEITTYTCAGLERAPDGGLAVHACGGEGDLTIPPASQPVGPQQPTPSPT